MSEVFELTAEAPKIDFTSEADAFTFGPITQELPEDEIVIAKPVEYGEEVAPMTGMGYAEFIREAMGSDLPMDEFLTKYGLDLEALQLTADFLNL